MPWGIFYSGGETILLKTILLTRLDSVEMKAFVCGLAFLLTSAATAGVVAQTNDRVDAFVRLFSGCHRRDKNGFDPCIKKAANDARRFFETGVPEFGIAPFDPFFAEEVVQIRGSPSLYYKLTLRNVYESGWTKSKVTKFRSDLTNANIRYHQYFPEKYLKGDWEMETNAIGPYSNSGSFDLSLYNYTQVTTVQKIGEGNPNPENPFSVRVEAIDCGDLKLHISNLLRGRATLETLLDRLINVSWRPGFHILKPLIDDLVSTAFTKIFNDDFRNFPFDAVIPE